MAHLEGTQLRDIGTQVKEMQTRTHAYLNEHKRHLDSVASLKDSIDAIWECVASIQQAQFTAMEQMPVQ